MKLEGLSGEYDGVENEKWHPGRRSELFFFFFGPKRGLNPLKATSSENITKRETF